MASPKIKFKRSAVASKRPSLSNLELGELALNTYDAKLFTVQDTSGVGIATTVALLNPWNEDYGGGTIRYAGEVRTGNINVKDLDGDNIFITGVTTSIGGFILRDPTGNNYSKNTNDPNYDDNTAPPSMDEDPIAAGIYADGSALFSGIVTSTSGFVGDLTGNVTGNVTGNITGNLTGTASNSALLAGLGSAYYLNYNNFTNTPTLITNNNQLTNGAGYITTSFTNTNQLTNGAGFLTATDSIALADFATNAGYAHTAGIATVSINAQGLTGNPNITVTNVVAQQTDVNGIATFHNKVHLLDNDVLHVGGAEGDDGDLQIYHDTNNSYIKDAGTGLLKILGGNTTIKNAADTKTSAIFNTASSVDLYFNNSLKLQTSSTGIDVTGHTETDTLNVSGIATAVTYYGDGSNLTGITAAGTGAIGGLTVKNSSGVVVGTAGSISTLDFAGSSNITVTATTGAAGIATIAITGITTANVISDTTTTGSLNVTGISTLGNINLSGNVTSNVTIVSTDTGSSASPEFKLYRNSSSPANGDYLGQIKFAGESDTGVERNYAKITGKIKDASNGTEDGIIEFAHIKDGSQNISGRWNSDTLQLINGTSLTVAGDLDVSGNITGNLTSSNLNVTGIATVAQAFYMPQYTTTARDAATFLEGAMIYNTTTKKMEFYDGTNWNTLPGMTIGLTVALDS